MTITLPQQGCDSVGDHKNNRYSRPRGGHNNPVEMQGCDPPVGCQNDNPVVALSVVITISLLTVAVTL